MSEPHKALDRADQPSLEGFRAPRENGAPVAGEIDSKGDALKSGKTSGFEVEPPTSDFGAPGDENEDMEN